VEPGPPSYPVEFDVAYPDRDLDRLSTAFRIVIALPILFLAGAFGGHAYGAGNQAIVAGGATGGVLFVPVALMIVFRQKYPRWWFDWNLELMRFSNRITVYLALMDDQYPSTDEHQSVRLDFPYPDAQNGLNRWLPIVKWLLAIPHYVVLLFLWVAAIVCVICAWFAILFTGRYPRGLFDFVVGVGRWALRVSAYAFLLTTDRYPPFSLSP
jgi:hypothetical protein